VAFYIVKNMAKICAKCKINKESTEFYKNKSRGDGLECYCKICSSKRTKEYRKNHSQEINKQRKIYRHENYKTIAKYRKKYYNNTSEIAKRYSKEYRKNHPEKISKFNKEYYYKNREKIISYQNKHQQQRKKTDARFKLKCNISNLILRRLKFRLLNKSGKSTFDFLPYTIDDLIKHLESQFAPWMNWNNYGNKPNYWSIDHIIPDSSFKYNSVDDSAFQKCWALSNLRPLNHIENIKKGKKLFI
jgi:hypothetical protein